MVGCCITDFFSRGAPSNWLGAREAHQLRVGGIVRATGPDPFGNCMPLPCLLLRALCELSVVDFDAT